MTLNEYLNVDCYQKNKQTGEILSHEDKYEKVLQGIGEERIDRMIRYLEPRIKASTDVHFNDIKLPVWDAVAECNQLKVLGMKHLNVGLSQSEMVCILKAKARKIRGW
jgi:hypothetical protein